MSRHNEALAGLVARPPMPCIIAAARQHAGTVLCVGGAVRDALLDRPAADVDVAVSGDLAAFVDAFARSCGRRPQDIGDAWRHTRRTFVDDVQVDIGTMLGSEAEDLSQRDFTINAMAVDLSLLATAGPTLIDLHGGARDVQRRVIRMLSATSLQDDPLRMLRAVRYLGTLDGFAIDEETEEAIRAHADDVTRVAAERVQTEWMHLLAGSRWCDAVERAAALGLDRPTLGARVDLQSTRGWAAFENAVDATVADADCIVVRLAAILGENAVADPAGAGRRLVGRRWPSVIAGRAGRVASWAARAAGAADDELVDWALRDPADAALAALLAQALGSKPGNVGIARLQRYACRAAEKRWLSGLDLRAWGMDPGPALGAVLREAARGQIARRWRSAEELRHWARGRAGEREDSRDG